LDSQRAAYPGRRAGTGWRVGRRAAKLQSDSSCINLAVASLRGHVAYQLQGHSYRRDFAPVREIANSKRLAAMRELPCPHTSPTASEPFDRAAFRACAVGHDIEHLHRGYAEPDCHRIVGFGCIILAAYEP